MPVFALKVVEGAMKGEEFQFEQTGLCLIGRDPSCSISIPREKDIGISRQHCLLIVGENDIRVRDLFSTNGTYVNGHRLLSSSIGEYPIKTEPNDRFLTDGDKIKISNIVLQLQIRQKLADSMTKTASFRVNDPIPTSQTTKTKLINFPGRKTRRDSLVPDPNPLDDGKILKEKGALEDTHLFLSLPITEPIPKFKNNVVAGGKKQEASSDTLNVFQPSSDKDKPAEVSPIKPETEIQTPKEKKLKPEEEKKSSLSQKGIPENIDKKEKKNEDIKTTNKQEGIKMKPEKPDIAIITGQSTQEKEAVPVEPPGEIETQMPDTSGESVPTVENKEPEPECTGGGCPSMPPISSVPQEEKRGNNVFDFNKMVAMEDFAGTLAVEYEKRLSVIRKYIELIQKSYDPDKMREYAGSIAKSAQFASDITEELLMFAAKEKVQETKDVHLGDIVSEIVSALKHTVSRNISIEYIKPYNNDFQIQGNHLEIYDSLLNIAFNAVDSLDGEGVVKLDIDRVSLKKSDAGDFALPLPEDGDYVKISISDTGAGISENALNHIFEPMFTTKSEDEAIGMGLSVSYGVIKKHNGAIEVESTLGKGSAFKVYLPVRANTENA